jgi:hypothetical protein
MLCTGVGVLAAGPAHAATAGSVLSDTIKAVGTISPGSVPQSYNLTATSCTQKSDGEKGKFPCQGSGGFYIGGSFNVVSSDGAIQCRFSLTGTGIRQKMSGTCTEQDNEGGVVLAPYPATMTGVFKLTGTTFNAVVRVWEASTAP